LAGATGDSWKVAGTRKKFQRNAGIKAMTPRTQALLNLGLLPKRIYRYGKRRVEFMVKRVAKSGEVT
jgi:hypothetical protein